MLFQILLTDSDTLTMCRGGHHHLHSTGLKAEKALPGTGGWEAPLQFTSTLLTSHHQPPTGHLPPYNPTPYTVHLTTLYLISSISQPYILHHPSSIFHQVTPLHLTTLHLSSPCTTSLSVSVHHCQYDSLGKGCFIDIHLSPGPRREVGVV